MEGAEPLPNLCRFRPGWAGYDAQLESLLGRHDDNSFRVKYLGLVRHRSPRLCQSVDRAPGIHTLKFAWTLGIFPHYRWRSSRRHHPYIVLHAFRAEPAASFPRATRPLRRSQLGGDGHKTAHCADGAHQRFPPLHLPLRAKHREPTDITTTW